MLVQRPLGIHPVGGIGMVQRRQQGMDLAVGGAALDPHGALAASRQAVFGADRGTDATLEAETNQPGGSQDDRVVLAGIQLGQTGINVATEELDFQVGAARQQLGLTAQTGSADHATGRQRIEIGVGVGYKGITRVFPFADAEQTEAGGEIHRHILHRMHSDVGFVLQQGGFQFLDEQTLAADLRQRCIEQLVTTTDHRHQADLETRMRLFQARLDVFGLPQGQGTLASGNTDFAGHDHFRKLNCRE